MASKENQAGANGATGKLFSKEDIREQYCITRKEIKTFEDKRSKKLFGCLVKASCAGSSSKDKKSKRSCIQSDEPSVAYGDDNNRQSESKPHESLSKKESSEYEDAGFRYRPKPFCLQNPNRFQYNPEAASQADTNSIRVVPCRSASAKPRLQSQHSSQGSITSSRTYLPNRSYEISYAIPPQHHGDNKQVSGCRSVDALNDVVWRGSGYYDQASAHLPEYSMTLDSRHSHHNHHHGATSAHTVHAAGHAGTHGSVSTTPRPKSVAAGVTQHQEPAADGSASMVRSNTVGGGLEDVDAMLVGPMATSTPLNVSRNRCNCHCSSFSVDNQENLADVTQYFMQRSFEESLSHSGRMSAARRALQKTAATQTATATADNTTCTSVTPTSSRTPEVPPDYLTLSPRTAQASASSSRKSSRRRKTSRDSSSRKAYTSIDSDTDESIDDELMEVDLHSAQHRLVASGSRHSLSSYQPTGQLETSPSPEHKSQSSQKQLATRTHRRSLSKGQVTSSFDASSTTLTTVDALLNASYDLDEDPHETAAASHDLAAPEAGSPASRHATSLYPGKCGIQQPGAVASPAHEQRARKGHGARRSSRTDNSNPHKQAISYAQYLLQPACDFPEEITGSFSAEVLSAAGAENLNSPDSESSSSRFTERESSCKSSTSSSAGVHRGAVRGSRSLQCSSAGIGQASTQDPGARKASLGLPLEEVKSDSTSADYVTATEGKNSRTITKGLSSHEGSTSFESAPEISSCPGMTPGGTAASVASAGSERGRSLEALDLPSPPVEMRQPGEHHGGVELPLSSEGEDDSTKKDDEHEQETGDGEDDEPEEEAGDNDDQSSEGEYSLGTAEAIEGETDKSDDDAEEDETLGRRDEEPMECMASTSSMVLPSPIETSSPKASHKRFPSSESQQQQPTHICEVFEDEMHGKALILPLMTFRDVQNALGRAELRQYDELSTVSEVSEENSTSEHQVTERYTPTSSCGSTGTIKRIYHRAESPQRKYFQEVHNEASVLDQDSVDLKDTSAELNASNDSGGTCIEVTPNDSADSLSMTFKPEEICAIMYGAVSGRATAIGSQQTPQAITADRHELGKDNAMVVTVPQDGGAVKCEVRSSDVVTADGGAPTTDLPGVVPSAKNEAAIPPPPFASARVTTVSAEIHQRGPAYDINSRPSSSGPSGGRNGAAPRSDAAILPPNKEQQHSTIGVLPTLGPTTRSAVGRLAESIAPKEGSSTEPGTPSSTPTSNSSSSGRKERQNANGDPPSNTKRSRTLSRGGVTEGSGTALSQCCSIVTSSQRREDNEDYGIHSDSFVSARWIYISKEDEMLAWKSNNNNAKNNNTEDKGDSLIIKTNVARCDSTESERAFQKQYTTVTHRMIHRKASLEMYKRITQRSLEPTKTVKIERQNGEFGFRIHGSRPVVVSAIEKGTPAESCGLEVGDIVVSINGVKVMDASHTEVVRVAHAGAETLKLELARTCHILAPKVDVPEPEMQGYLQRLSSTSSSRRWCRRWFVLNKSGQLSWFMAHGESDPLGALMADNLRVERVVEPGAEHAFKVTFTFSTSGGNNSKKNGTAPVGGGTYFAADDEDSATKWIMAFKKMANPSLTHQERYLEEVKENLQRPVNAMTQTDCQGFLCKFSDRAVAWRSYYLVLKDASLYIYEDRNDLRALGVYLLHGYRVQSSSAMGKRNIFEAIAPGPLPGNLLFLAETEQEKKRWLASLEYSIDRWLRL